jgi:hypothetical protein
MLHWYSRLDGEELVGEPLLHFLLDNLEASLGKRLEPLAVGPGVSISL